MNFPDLRVRLITGMMLWAVLGLWIYCSMKNPMVFPVGLVIMASICLYEWFRMGAGKSIPLRMAGAAIIGFGFWTCYDLAHREPGVAFICLLVPITDTVAYFGGRLMGGPKLCPAISSSKNWAGFLSVVIGVPFLAFLYILPSLNGNGAKNAILLIPSLSFLGLITQAGNLPGSWAKRQFDVKDSGSWLPGHGGLLDRLDSTLFISIVMFFLFVLMNYLLQRRIR